MAKRILITGAAGYIGSHVALLLLQKGHQIIALDNLCNSTHISLQRVAALANAPPEALQFHALDIQNLATLQTLLATHKPDAVLHFAGLKSLNESLAKPLLYYEVNIGGTLNLVRACESAGVRTFVFSSSAAVYGNPSAVPVNESMPTAPQNPYALSKRVIEHCLNKLAHSTPPWRIASLRYFNPAGAHPSGQLGDSPLTPATHLMPLLANVALRKQPHLRIFGHDWPTPDRTCVRDYIHIMDLAAGHVAALERLFQQPDSFTINLGTGTGYSVLNLLHAFEKASGQSIPYVMTARRPGDVATCYADPTLAHELLGWKAKHSLQILCQDAWHWYQNNPNGYKTAPITHNVVDHALLLS